MTDVTDVTDVTVRQNGQNYLGPAVLSRQADVTGEVLVKGYFPSSYVSDVSNISPYAREG